MASNTSVEDWLRSLGLLSYTEAFIDNGYDDLDICKQIGDEDLDAIGVINSKDRKDILYSVKALRDKGVNAVYFQLEGDETTENNHGQTADREKYRRDDLINKMKDLLAEDNCVLPENNPNTEYDPLDDLTQYYADQLYTYFQDVKEVLEYLRDGESNEGKNDLLHDLPKGQMKKHINSNLFNESRLSKSLNSLETTAIKGKVPKSPKHGIGRIFGSRKKNHIQQPPKITGPAETAMIIAHQVQMSDEDRKNLMLKVKHGDITQDEALSNFLSYEATHTPFSKEQEKESTKQQKKKRGFFNRNSFKRHSSGHSSDMLASNIPIGEKERMELMRKIKAGEITSVEAWDSLKRFGSKRESKKSPKGNQRGSKSPKEISASVTHLSSTFYTVGVSSEISQSTSNIHSRAGSTDSSPDSTPGLSRKFDHQHGYTNSVEQLNSSGSFESMERGNQNKPRHLSSHSQKRSSSPLAHNDVRRTLSAKYSDAHKEIKQKKRRSTLSSFSDVSTFSPTTEVIPDNKNKPKAEPPLVEKGPAVPPRRPPKLPPNKPILYKNENKTSDNEQNSGVETLQGEKPIPNIKTSPESIKPKIPEKPSIPAKPPLLPRPKPKPNKSTNECEENKNVLVNGTDNTGDSSVISTKGEATEEQKVTRRLPPRRPSPLTRVSRYKPLGATLLEMIERKLTEENIDLVQAPYTIQAGEWGVPMALIDRYSCELHSTMREVAKEMDHIRIEKLNQANESATPCDLSTVRFAPDVVGKLSSLEDWLTSLGLPMYICSFKVAGYEDIHQIPYLSEEHLNYANITNPDHIKRLTRSLENMTPTFEQDSPFAE